MVGSRKKSKVDFRGKLNVTREQTSLPSRRHGFRADPLCIRGAERRGSGRGRVRNYEKNIMSERSKGVGVNLIPPAEHPSKRLGRGLHWITVSFFRGNDYDQLPGRHCRILVIIDSAGKMRLS